MRVRYYKSCDDLEQKTIFYRHMLTIEEIQQFCQEARWNRAERALISDRKSKKAISLQVLALNLQQTY